MLEFLDLFSGTLLYWYALSMKIKVHPRFYVIVGIVLFGVILFSSNVFLKKRVEVNLVDSSAEQVLAAEDATLFGNKQEILEEQKSDTETEKNINNNMTSKIASYTPVTISHTVKEGDTLQGIAEKYHADAQTIADFPNNKLGDSLQLTVGQIIIIPNGYVDESFAPPPPPVAVGSGQFMWPVEGAVTQYAFYWHPGSIDIAIDLLTPVKAADSGKVKEVNHYTTGYGVHVIVDHGNGLTSLYAHLTASQVSVGQTITKGEVLGMSGSTGRSTGPHLHFEVERNGVPVDPMTLLPPR